MTTHFVSLRRFASLSVAITVLTSSAVAAQTPVSAPVVEVSAVYQFLHIGGYYSMASGWGAAIAASGQNKRTKVVFDGSGHYDDGLSFHTFQGGVEIAGSNTTAKPFFQLLGGVGLFGRRDGGSSTVFVLTPEVGAKIMGSRHVGAQLSVGFPLMIGGGEIAGSVRLSVGIVIRSK